MESEYLDLALISMIGGRKRKKRRFIILTSIIIFFFLLFLFTLTPGHLRFMEINDSDIPLAGDDDGGLLGGLVDGFLNGLKSLFIPDDNFFASFNADIQSAIDRKTGGLATYFSNITNEFNRLQNSHSTNNALTLKMPDNHLYNGYRGVSVNLLGGIDSFSVWFRGLFSAFMVITTIILCYRRVISLFKG